MQKEDAEDGASANISESIFSLFLELANSRVTWIIRLKPQADKNSTYYWAFRAELQYKDWRLAS